MEDPEQTELVFEITQAMAGKQPRRLLRRIRATTAGERLLREQPIFDDTTVDLDQLATLPEGSFGHEFTRWMRHNGVTPGLMERESTASDPDLAYLGKRLTQVHDFWHVLSGYNRDPIGELGVLAFTFAQSGSYGIGLIVGMVVWRSMREHWRTERRPWSPLIPYVWRGYHVGRRAQFLPPLILEELFPLPLESVRALLQIQPLRRSFTPEALPPIAAPSVG
jgi:ubiquinone biosynthesis protein COQ4